MRCCSFATVTQTKNRKPRSRFAFCSKVFLGNLYVRSQKRLYLQATCILSYCLIQSRWSECTILSRVVRTSVIHIWSLKIYLHTIRPLGTIEKSKLTALYLPKLQHTNYSTLQNLLRTTIRGLVEPMVLVVQNYVDHTCTSVKRGGRTYLPYTCEEDGEIRHFDWWLICKGSPTNKKKKDGRSKIGIKDLPNIWVSLFQILPYCDTSLATGVTP